MRQFFSICFITLSELYLIYCNSLSELSVHVPPGIIIMAGSPDMAIAVNPALSTSSAN